MLKRRKKYNNFCLWLDVLLQINVIPIILLFVIKMARHIYFLSTWNLQIDMIAVTHWNAYITAESELPNVLDDFMENA